MKNCFPVTTILSLTFALMIAGCQETPPTSKKTENSINQPAVSNSPEPTTKTSSVLIEPGDDAQKKAQEALILAEPGSVIEFAEGKFEFDGTLSIDGIEKVTVKGQGIDKTILNFAGMQAGKGGEGMKVKANDFILEDLTIEDTPGDAIKLQDCNGLKLRRVKTWWTGGPNTDNGAYGLYPVLCNNVLIEHCVAECASDSGIYVGQSKNVIVRNCKAERNVAGIEIENCIGADVYSNYAANNTAGILVFSLPGLTVKNGSDCRVFNNEMIENNLANFAPEGAIVSTVPAGTGMMIMANDRVEAFKNKFQKNDGAGCLIVSFLVSQRKYDDAEYDPYPESISLHDNTFVDGGGKAEGEFLQAYSKMTGKRLPDIVFDGILDAQKMVDGKFPPELTFSIKEKPEVTFVNLDLGTAMSGQQPNIRTDLDVYSAEFEPIKEVSIPGVN